jgi:ferredoxin, 2Fe-2S
MAQIRVVPSEVDFSAEPGTTVFAAAHDAGLRWPTVCGGQGSCHTCVMRVVEGAHNLSPVGTWEEEGLRELGLTDDTPEQPYRLACQAQVRGDVVVRKSGVRDNETKG